VLKAVTHAQTWASYSAVYWFCSLSFSVITSLRGNGRKPQRPLYPRNITGMTMIYT